MSWMPNRAAMARILPFAIYILVLAVEIPTSNGPLGYEFDERWLYPIKIGLVVLALLWFTRDYTDLRNLPERMIWLWLWAPMVGAAVFLLWINLDSGWFVLDFDGVSGSGYDPRDSKSGELIWALLIMRVLGAAIVVPIMEELFWRSFLMRWIDHADFLLHSPAAVSLRAILISSVVFGIEHSLWFAGVLAGLAYAWLYRLSGSLWVPIFSHAVTNFMLAIWVVQTEAWQYW